MASQALCPLDEMDLPTHSHGRRVHAHVHDGRHRHLLHPCRSAPLAAAVTVADVHQHGHSHGLVDDSIKRSREGLRAVALALAVLGLTAAAQVLVFLLSGSVALLADLIHNTGDAATAIPAGDRVRTPQRPGRALRGAGGGGGHLRERVRRGVRAGSPSPA